MPHEEYKWIDPLKFTESDLPTIILEEDRQGLFGWAIRWHNKDNYNHIQWMVRLGFVATQNPLGYKEIPIEKCMVKRTFMKFWQFDPIDRREVDIIRRRVMKNLNKPWWARRYDFIGILGQAIGIRWIQSPFGKYCSESLAADLRSIPRFRKIIPRWATPSELNQIFKSLPDMKLRGYWYTD